MPTTISRLRSSTDRHAVSGPTPARSDGGPAGWPGVQLAVGERTDLRTPPRPRPDVRAACASNSSWTQRSLGYVAAVSFQSTSTRCRSAAAAPRALRNGAAGACSSARPAPPALCASTRTPARDRSTHPPGRSAMNCVAKIVDRQTRTDSWCAPPPNTSSMPVQASADRCAASVLCSSATLWR